VIGVVETARWGGITDEPQAQFYLPLDNMPFAIDPARVLVLRSTNGYIANTVEQTRTAIRAEFPSGEPWIDRMSTLLEPQYRPWRLGATLFSMFGILAALVTAVGVYSSVSYGVSQRMHEFGVRLAIGAQFTDIVQDVVTGGMRTVLIGVCIGVALTLAAGRLMATLVYGIGPRDPVAIITVVAAVLGVAIVASLVPAWRAARIDPVAVLRSE
jgi:ABC-type antimicrobial peptide transport system permease subunit